MSEWLRRWTRNPLGSAREGSNPFGVVFFSGFRRDFFLLRIQALFAKHGKEYKLMGYWAAVYRVMQNLDEVASEALSMDSHVD